jgi:hypothetical protein
VKAAQISDAPTDLQNVVENTFANQIGLSWVAPVFDGGSVLLDYRLWTDNASGVNFEVLIDGLTDTNYIVTGLT